MRVRLPPLASTAHKGKDEEEMGKDAKIKAATKAQRITRPTPNDIAAIKKMQASGNISDRSVRRSAARSRPPHKTPLPTVEFRTS